MGEASTAGQRGEGAAADAAAPPRSPPRPSTHRICLSLSLSPGQRRRQRAGRPASDCDGASRRRRCRTRRRAGGRGDEQIHQTGQHERMLPGVFWEWRAARARKKKNSRRLISGHSIFAFSPPQSPPNKPACAASPSFWPSWPWPSPRRVSVFRGRMREGRARPAGDMIARVRNGGASPLHLRPAPPATTPSRLEARRLRGAGCGLEGRGV